MKKLVTIITAIIALQMANAQDGNNICVWNAMNTYNSGGGPADLEGGIKCADLAAVHESTINKSKTWHYRGKLFTFIFLDSVARAKTPNSGMEAANAFKKLNELNDPKFRDWDEVNSLMNNLAITLFNEGADAFQNKNYVLAGQYFSVINELSAISEAHKGRFSIDGNVATRNAIMSYDNAGQVKEAQSLAEQAYKNHPDSLSSLRVLIQITKKAISAKSLEAEKTANQARLTALLDEGLTKTKNKDAGFLSDKINSYLVLGDFAGALKYVNSFIEAEPKNPQGYIIRAQAYDQMAKDTTVNKNDRQSYVDSVSASYDRALVINPNEVSALNNKAKLIVDETIPLIEQMNKLGSSSADNAKYEVLKAKVQDIYKRALPLLEKAHELDPKDASIERSYKQIKLKIQ